MKIERQKIGSIEVLTPVGALVDDDAERFRKILEERLAAPNPRVVISLAEVPCIDSVALEALVNAGENLAAGGGGLKLAGVTPTCREVLELTGLASQFRLFNEVQDAVKSYL